VLPHMTYHVIRHDGFDALWRNLRQPGRNGPLNAKRVPLCDRQTLTAHHVGTSSEDVLPTGGESFAIKGCDVKFNSRAPRLIRTQWNGPLPSGPGEPLAAISNLSNKISPLEHVDTRPA